MAGVGPFEPAFMQNVLVAQRDNAQMFKWAMQIGVGIVGLQVVTNASIRFVAWIYDKVKHMWQPKLGIGEQQSDSPASEMFPQRGRRFEEQFANVAPEEAGWAAMGDNTTTQPQPAVAQ